MNLKVFPSNDANLYEFCEIFIQSLISNNLIYHFKTSGSTGSSKDIEITYEQIKSSCLMTQKALGLKKGYNALVCLNTAYTAGKMMLARCHFIGMNAIVVPPSSNPFEFLPQDQSIDFAAFVPYQLNSLLNNNTTDINKRLNSMKVIIIGGEPVNEELESKIKKLDCPVFHTFGMTETLSHIALRRLNGSEKTDLFETLPGVKIEQDERGCLKVKATVTNDQWITTNDIVEISPPQKFKWIGRADFVINSGGIKVQIEPLEQEIKGILNSLGINRNFLILGIPDQVFNELVCLLLEGPEMTQQTESLLKDAFRKKIHPYKSPRKFLYKQTFNFTPTGKIDRKATTREFV